MQRSVAGAITVPAGEQRQNTKRIRREYEGNTKRIRWQHRSLALAPSLFPACNTLSQGFEGVLPGPSLAPPPAFCILPSPSHAAFLEGAALDGLWGDYGVVPRLIE